MAERRRRWKDGSCCKRRLKRIWAKDGKENSLNQVGWKGKYFFFWRQHKFLNEKLSSVVKKAAFSSTQREIELTRQTSVMCLLVAKKRKVIFYRLKQEFRSNKQTATRRGKKGNDKSSQNKKRKCLRKQMKPKLAECFGNKWTNSAAEKTATVKHENDA